MEQQCLISLQNLQEKNLILTNHQSLIPLSKTNQIIALSMIGITMLALLIATAIITYKCSQPKQQIKEYELQDLKSQSKA